MNIPSQTDELRAVLQADIYDTTVQRFFDQYESVGCLDEYMNILGGLSTDAQEMVLSAQVTQVHKEKALWPVFIARGQGLDVHRAVQIGAATEMLWGLSTIVDDLLDNDSERNGKPSEWFRLGRTQVKEKAGDVLKAILKYLSEQVDPLVASAGYEYVNWGVDSIGMHHKMSFDTPESDLLWNYIARDSFHTYLPVEALASPMYWTGEAKQILNSLRLGLTLFNQAGQIANDMSDMKSSKSKPARLNDLREGHCTVASITLYNLVSDEAKCILRRLYGVHREYTYYERNTLMEIINNQSFVESISRRIIDTYKRGYNLLAPCLNDEDTAMVDSWILYKTARYRQ
ncbi:hypothetical protein CO058_02020 [candidate division WWE3 bacterium CG_4_9_14_0_2_um_filter_35_11]|uniref:Polyprenyl synthetase n=1 Tax=candidate division WWE3 bacterium CG_4_9_14_0_2_um_filter_35_11 TaxID=1975077 RepID=A0A2M8ELW6_UNCKA|nr:MAG: hypothetical protein CO058_02020 [candidate division WWE3 bacterium CG_4_9_14_0_2_um_filter_35_11]